jgi:hypothetical protein
MAEAEDDLALENPPGEIGAQREIDAGRLRLIVLDVAMGIEAHIERIS